MKPMGFERCWLVAAMALSSISVTANSYLLKRLKIKDYQTRTIAQEQSEEQKN